MSTVNIHAAKTHLSRLIEEAASGKEVIIARAGVPVAKLVAIKPGEQGKRPLGLAAGRKIPDHYFEPLPEDIVDLFYNGPIGPDDEKR
jgi:prevent-host-death family protein